MDKDFIKELLDKPEIYEKDKAKYFNVKEKFPDNRQLQELFLTIKITLAGSLFTDAAKVLLTLLDDVNCQHEVMDKQFREHNHRT